MTQTKLNHHIHSLHLKAVKLTPVQLEYLCGMTKKGASRLGAYLSLLQEAVETETSYTPPYGQPFNLVPGQLVISITDLSKRWNWARETVRKFIDQLVSLKLLTKESLDRCSLITMTIEWLDVEYEPVFLYPFPAIEIPKQLTDCMDTWLCGDSVDDELLESIGDTIRSFDDTDDNGSSYRIVSLQYGLIRQLIKRWAASYADIPESADGGCMDLLSRLFNTVLSGNWNLWLTLLKELSPGISKEVIASNTDRFPGTIVDGRVILDCLFQHLKVDFNRNRP